MHDMIGIDRETGERIVEKLRLLLANTLALQLKMRSAYWNVKGIHFGQHRRCFETLYQETDASIDSVAQRIVTLGYRAPGNLKEIRELAEIHDGILELSGEELLRDLWEDFTWLVPKLHEWAEEASKAGDRGTERLYYDRIEAMERQAWMIQAHLG